MEIPLSFVCFFCLNLMLVCMMCMGGSFFFLSFSFSFLCVVLGAGVMM